MRVIAASTRRPRQTRLRSDRKRRAAVQDRFHPPLDRWGGSPLRWQKVWAKRSEEHTSELQSLMRISYAVFCLKKKRKRKKHTTTSLTSENNEHKDDNNVQLNRTNT